MSSKSDRPDVATQTNNHAQDLGSRANLVDNIIHAIERPFRSDQYKAGRDNGAAHPKKD